MSIIGTWDASLRSPIGTIRAVFVFRSEDGVLVGSARNADETIELRDLVQHEAGRVTWSQSVRRPLRLDLAFDVTVDGDTWEGVSRAGRLPRTPVSATRQAP
jgi:hypothetical protein